MGNYNKFKNKKNMFNILKKSLLLFFELSYILLQKNSFIYYFLPSGSAWRMRIRIQEVSFRILARKTQNSLF